MKELENQPDKALATLLHCGRQGYRLSDVKLSDVVTAAFLNATITEADGQTVLEFSRAVGVADVVPIQLTV